MYHLRWKTGKWIVRNVPKPPPLRKILRQEVDTAEAAEAAEAEVARSTYWKIIIVSGM